MEEESLVEVCEDQYVECLRQLDEAQFDEVITVLDEEVSPDCLTTYLNGEIIGQIQTPPLTDIFECDGEEWPRGTEFYLLESVYEKSKSTYH